MRTMVEQQVQVVLRQRWCIFALLSCLLLWPFAVLSTEPEWTDISGTVHHLDSYRGKWVVVNYWASWCRPCVAEMAGLDRFYQRHKGHDAVVLGINYEDVSVAQLRAFLRRHPVSYPIIQVVDNGNSYFGPIFGLPTTFIIGPTGKLMAHQEGALRLEDLENYLVHRH